MANGKMLASSEFGLGARLIGHAEGVGDDQSDDAEGGDGRGYIEIGEQARLGLEQRLLLRIEEPGREVQREADRHHHDGKPQMRQAVDGEGDRRGDDVIDLDARLAAEGADE